MACKTPQKAQRSVNTWRWTTYLAKHNWLLRVLQCWEPQIYFFKFSLKCTLGVGCARPTMACLSGVVATALISKLWGSSCVTVVKKGGPGREDPGKWVDDPFTSLWPRKYKATCLRMVDVRGPLSCWTAVKRDSSDTEQEVRPWSGQVYISTFRTWRKWPPLK